MKSIGWEEFHMSAAVAGVLHSWSGASVIVTWLIGPSSVIKCASDDQHLRSLNNTNFVAKLLE